MNSIVVSSNSLLVVSCEVDPLYSFKDAILENDAMVERNEFSYDVYQEDPLLPLEMTKTIEEDDVIEGSLVNIHFDAEWDENNPDKKYYSCTIGSIGSIDYKIPALRNLPAISTYRTGDAGGSAVFGLDFTNVANLLTDLMGNFSAYSTFFKSLVAFPFEIPDFSDDSELAISIWEYEQTTDPATGKLTTAFVTKTTSAYGKYIPSTSSYLVAADFEMPEVSSFLELQPYSHYEIYIPFLGWKEININELSGHRILVYYAVNYQDGSAEAVIYDYDLEAVLFSSPCQVGIPLSLSSTDSQELLTQKNSMQTNLILSLVGSGVGMVGSAISKNVIGMVGSGLSAVQAITDYVNKDSMMFTHAQVSLNGSAGGMYAPLNVRLRKTSVRMREGLNLTKFAHQFGRPLREIRKLSSLSGFTQIAQIHLESIDATQPEKDIIESSLLRGVIL